MKLLAPIFRCGRFRLALAFFLFARTPSLGIGLCFLESRLFFCRSGSSELRLLARIFVGVDAFLLGLLPLLFLATYCLFFISLETFLFALLSLNAFFFFATLAVQLFLFLLRLLLKNIALDVRALLANLDIDCTRAALRPRQSQFRL